MLDAAIKADKWGPAADVWRKIFQSELEVKGTDPLNVFNGLNLVGSQINKLVKGPLSTVPGRRPEPIGMAMQEEGGKTYYYMTLNKDDAALAANRKTILEGKESDTVLKLGPFEQVTPARQPPGQKT